jgi:hypothetical protein
MSVQPMSALHPKADMSGLMARFDSIFWVELCQKRRSTLPHGVTPLRWRFTSYRAVYCGLLATLDVFAEQDDCHL